MATGSYAKGDRLVDEISAAGPEPEAAGQAAHDLLQELFAGYPVERLKWLLISANPGAVSAGAWLASELAGKARPVLDKVAGLLEYPDPRVRFHAVETVQSAATAGDGAIVAKAVTRVNDENEFVRWGAAQLLARAPSANLTSAMPFLAGTSLGELLAWLMDQERTADEATVLARIDDPDEPKRIFAAAAAVRLLERTSRPLDHAAASTHPAVRDFAAQQLRISGRLHPRRRN